VKCHALRSSLSSFLDGDLDHASAREVKAHLEQCSSCRDRLMSLRGALEALGEMPRVASPEPIAERVRERLLVERRGPGLALLFRSRFAARPLMLPSLIPAACAVLVVLTASVFASRDPRATVPAEDLASVELPPVREARQGTEGNPLFPSSEVGLPRQSSGADLPVQALAAMREGTLFLETVVARDGSVSTVTLLEGDSDQAGPLVEALRQARFEPVRVRGRAVAVSVYRLISRTEVLAAPRT
jgi:hypothetical protein